MSKCIIGVGKLTHRKMSKFIIVMWQCNRRRCGVAWAVGCASFGASNDFLIDAEVMYRDWIHSLLGRAFA